MAEDEAMLFQKGKNEYNIKGKIFQICKEKYFFTRKISSCSHFHLAYPACGIRSNLSLGTTAVKYMHFMRCRQL